MKELTSEQKLLILDLLKLTAVEKHNVDGINYYSEGSVLRLMQKFNDAIPEQSHASHQTVIMPSEQEIRDEAFETHQEINPDTQQYIWKYAFDDDQADAFITGAKYALSQVKAIDLREELIKFAKECIYVNETPRSFLTVSDIDEYLTQK